MRNRFVWVRDYILIPILWILLAILAFPVIVLYGWGKTIWVNGKRGWSGVVLGTFVGPFIGLSFWTQCVMMVWTEYWKALDKGVFS